MTAKGLAEISQPNKVLMSNLQKNPLAELLFFYDAKSHFLIEIQALVGKKPCLIELLYILKYSIK